MRDARPIQRAQLAPFATHMRRSVPLAASVAPPVVGYREVHGRAFDDPCLAAACSLWNRPPRGGFGRASSAACFSRRARWIGVSPGSSVMWLPSKSYRWPRFIVAVFERMSAFRHRTECRFRPIADLSRWHGPRRQEPFFLRIAMPASAQDHTWPLAAQRIRQDQACSLRDSPYLHRQRSFP